MKKLFLVLLIYSSSLIIHAQESKRIPFKQLSFTKSVFDERQSKVIFKGGKWDSFIKLPASINQELPKYKYRVIDIPFINDVKDIRIEAA